MRKKLPKTNGRIGALPPLDGGQGTDGDDKEISSKRARSYQESPLNALSPSPETINVTKVSASPDVHQVDDSSTVIV